jgi:transposase
MVMEKVFRKELKMEEAAEVLGVSERQAYRIKARIRLKGARGAVHGNRGRICPWRLSEEKVEEILELYKEKYRGFNDSHFTEKLNEEEGMKVSREKVRQTLRAGGIEAVRKRRAPKYRHRRARKESEGMMLQVDGSYDDWIEGRGEALCLIGAVDDATGKVVGAMFEDAETTAGYFKLFREIFRKKGLPASIYSDRHKIFISDREPTIEEQLANKKPLTQVGRALEELGIELIPAYSPQAKGRIERVWGTFQDRLKSELRLAGAKNKADAQIVLKRFLPDYNRRFAKPPQNPSHAYRPLPHSLNLKYVLCSKFQRTVANDNTISFNGSIFQIPMLSPHLSFAHKKVDIFLFPDSKMEIFYKNTKIANFYYNINLEKEVA